MAAASRSRLTSSQNIQSTNWQTVRFKPPPTNSPIGWRVEFRPMEVQLTDFENAAFAVFIVLLSRAILHFNLNLYIPISKVTPAISQGSTASDANMYHVLTPVARWTRTWPGRSVEMPCDQRSFISARMFSLRLPRKHQGHLPPRAPP